MKLDPTVLRTMDAQDFKVLEAVEKGMQRHQLVPAPLIASLSKLRHGGTGKVLGGLLRDKLLSHDKSCGYDGYRVTSAGYDILALQNLKARKIIAAFGDRIGTGKESDIYLAVHPNGQQVVLKIHRLGRTSFRNVKKTRDYFVYTNKKGEVANNQANSWLFLSRKSALKEYAFMKALYSAKFRTPEPIAHNRHIVCMSLIRGVPLFQITSNKLSSEQAASIFEQASDLALRLAKHGLVHCDLNEFNLLVDMSGIQQTALHGEHDPYVRHSGLSVAASTPGTLSGRGAWETAYTTPGELQEVEEAPPKPTILLENGEAKPIVTLIDFPQMVSTQHPNAKELYERDMACLHRFFTHKLHCRIPEEDEAKLLLQWEDVVEELAKQQPPSASDAGEVDDTESVCLVPSQLRLDQDLKASGYSQADSSRDMELYYYYNNDPSRENAETGEIKEEGEGDDENENDEQEDEESNHDGNNGNEDAQHDNDIDNDSIESQEDDNVTITSTMMQAGQFADMTRQQLQEQARLRVQQHLETAKKKGRQQGAFRKQNSNKTYLKGKRVFDDVLL
jgi:RIO kinase 2